MEIWRDADGHVMSGQAIHPERATCFACNGIADAVWHGNPDVYVCRDCSLEHLPKLIADAVAAKCRDCLAVHHILGIEDRIMKTLWYAVACALQGRKSGLRVPGQEETFKQ